MTPQMRNFYKLEKRWKEAEVTNIPQPPQTLQNLPPQIACIRTLPPLTSSDIQCVSFRFLVTCALPFSTSTTTTTTTQGVSFRVAIPANYAALCAVKRRYTITGRTPSDRTYRPPYRAEKCGSIWSRRGTHNLLSPAYHALFYFLTP